jgi:hypothetical protein
MDRRVLAAGDRRGDSPVDPETFVGALRERIYATLTGISVLTLLLIHVDEESVGSAVSSLAVTLVTLWLASLLSESLAHGLLGHRDGPDRREVWREIMFTAGQSLTVLVVPTALLLLSLTDLLSLRAAIILAIASMVLTLAAAAIAAMHRSTIPFWGRVLVILAEVALGLLVIAGKVIGH